jgi:cytochrome c2
MRRLLSLGIACGLFVYGFTAGVYRLPPFHQVAWMKNAVVERMFPRVETYVPPTPQSATLVPSALQRLLQKRIALPNESQDFAGGGALAVAGDLVYVFTRDGHIAVMNMAVPRKLTTDIYAVPLNRLEFMQSKARYEMPLGWFRVNGAMAEVVDDSTHVLFATHDRFDTKRECFTYHLSRITIRHSLEAARAAEQWETIFSSAPCMPLQGKAGAGRHPFSGHISGGRMIAFDEQRLLVTVGDFNFDGYLRPAWSMDPSNPYGKYLLIDKETGASEIFAIGARNNMGLYRDVSGTIWSTESGPQGGDELNVVVRGENYGWPTSTYGIGYESTPWEPSTEEQGRHDRYRQPVLAWMPSIVPTAIIRMEGHPGTFEAWRGDLLVATLRDQSLHRLRLDSSGRVVYDERIWLGERMRDLVRLPDGQILLLTDATGQLVILADGGPEFMPASDSTPTWLAALDRFDALSDAATVAATLVLDGEGLFGQKCASCHAIDGLTITGPSLDGVLRRRVGGRTDYSYSASLATDGRPWSSDLMRRYLLTPELDFPNTRMQKIGLTQLQSDSIIAYLSRLSP